MLIEKTIPDTAYGVPVTAWEIHQVVIAPKEQTCKVTLAGFVSPDAALSGKRFLMTATIETPLHTDIGQLIADLTADIEASPSWPGTEIKTRST